MRRVQSIFPSLFFYQGCCPAARSFGVLLAASSLLIAAPDLAALQLVPDCTRHYAPLELKPYHARPILLAAAASPYGLASGLAGGVCQFLWLALLADQGGERERSDRTLSFDNSDVLHGCLAS